jgi:hypothetical protein
MYKVIYLVYDSPIVHTERFESFKEAAQFGLSQPENMIIEINYYDNKTDNPED